MLSLFLLLTLNSFSLATYAETPKTHSFLGKQLHIHLVYNVSVTVVLWTSSHILYGLPLHQKGDVSKATC